MANTRLSVSTIAMLLTKPEYLLSGANVEAMELGRMIHAKVYPTRQNKLCKNVDGVDIVGYPDTIRDGIIEELKIINGGSREGQLEYACVKANIYCYLAGLYRYRIRLFGISILKEEQIEFDADHDKALQNIRRAISIQTELHKVIGVA